MALIPNIFSLSVNPVDVPVHLYVPVSEHCKDSMVWFNQLLVFLCNILETPVSLLNVISGTGLPFI